MTLCQGPAVPNSPGGAGSTLRILTPRGHSTLLNSPTRVLVPVTTRASSPEHPLFPTPLEWDRSCLQEPFLGGQSNFLGIQRLENRKPSDTNPHLIDDDKVIIVSTASSSFNSSIVRLVESARNVSRTVMSTMTTEAEDLLEQVDSLMGRMEINPVSDIREEFIENSLIRLEGMTKDAENCLKLFMTWKRRYTDETNTDLKKQVEDEVSKLKTDFTTYQVEMAARKKALPPNCAPPPPAQEKKEEQAFQIQGAMNQLPRTLTSTKRAEMFLMESLRNPALKLIL